MMTAGKKGADMISKRQFLAGGGALGLTLAGGIARAADGPVTVPIHVYRERVTVIPVTLDGKGPYPFALATGSPLNVIDGDLATDLGLAPAHVLRNLLLDNKSVSQGQVDSSREVACDAVAIGAYGMGRRIFTVDTIRPEHMAHHIKGLSRPDFPRGVVGTNTFLDAPCVIDLAGGQATFYPVGAPDLSGFAEVDIHLENTDMSGDKSLVIHTRLDGERLDCFPDSGGNTELYLTSRYVRKHHLWDAFTDFSEHDADAHNPSRGKVRQVRMRGFTLGPLVFDEINVSLADPLHSDHLDEAGVTAVVGRGLLSQAVMVFADGHLYMRANATFAPVSAPYVEPVKDED